ncbi:MAG TPA: CYTH and CHAD domain-containing protein, partial [Stellaceae bacterium]|nr:CYTH and CHAD domain-containing protein [Stellaceae bacterium]
MGSSTAGRLPEEAIIAIEIELKLAIAARNLPALARALEARGKPGEKSRARLVSTYFDTSDRALVRQGLVLRVRERDGHFVQTVKSGDRAGAALPDRGEWEDAIAGPQPESSAPESGPLIDKEIFARLAPLFRTEITRRAIMVSVAPDACIEAAIDRGRVVVAGSDREQPVSEIELELKNGPRIAVYDLALDLLAVAPLRLELRSKAERGYRLAAPDLMPATADHGRDITLDPSLSGDEALHRIGMACIQQILRNEAPLLAGNAEGVHQMRVAMRRLRAILSAFGKLLPDEQWRPVSEELHWLADALGAARNLDVFKASLSAPMENATGDSDGIGALGAAAERRRQTAYANAASAVRSTRYTRLILLMSKWFEGREWREAGASPALSQPIGELAEAILDRRRHVVKRRSKGFGRQTDQQRHRLRISLKKLRYTAEMLAGLFAPDVVKKFTKRLKHLQDDLGDA